MVESSGKRLLGIINNILDFSKIEAGKMELYMHSFSLSDKIDELITLLSHKAEKQNVVLQSSISPDIPSILIGDADKLMQIMINLVNNGLKFCKDGMVTIKVTTEKMKQDRLTLQFDIIDTGIGIPEEKEKKIFEAFAQADTSHTRKFGGTGLGLTISSQLCRLLGGEIGLSSQENNGSTFWFTACFTLATEEAQDVLTKHGTLVKNELSREVLFKGIRILLAEDEFINMTLAMTLLEQEGMVVKGVANGQKVLEVLVDETYDILLLDMQMPELDGYQTTELIRKQEEETGGHLPIIAMTAHAMEGDRQKCIAAGMDEYISKPINKNAILSTLEKILIKTALVVDDDPVNRAFAAGMMKKTGWDVTVAENSTQALYECDRANFDLILMDIMIPEIDALKTCELIRQKEKETNKLSHIIGLNGIIQEKYLQQCLLAGMDDFIEKPLSKAKIEEKLAKFSLNR